MFVKCFTIQDRLEHEHGERGPEAAVNDCKIPQCSLETAQAELEGKLNQKYGGQT